MDFLSLDFLHQWRKHTLDRCMKLPATHGLWGGSQGCLFCIEWFYWCHTQRFYNKSDCIWIYTYVSGVMKYLIRVYSAFNFITSFLTLFTVDFYITNTPFEIDYHQTMFSEVWIILLLFFFKYTFKISLATPSY